MAAEYEFYQFRAPSDHPSPERAASNTASFLQNNPVDSLPSLTEGMFGYSITRPLHNQDYYYGIFDDCEAFRCDIEGWHTESGPGVFEAVSIQIRQDRAVGRIQAKCVYRHCNLVKQRKWPIEPSSSSENHSSRHS